MLSKKVLKDIQSLSLKKCRDETGLFIAEGPKIAFELIEAIPQQVQQVYALPQWVEEHKNIANVKVETITEPELQKISGLKTPNQVVVVLKKFNIEEPVIDSGFAIYLDAIQDPGNFGTIIRIADWFGIKNIICGEGCADMYNPKVIQSTMASIARVQVWYDRTKDWLQKQKLPIIAASLHGPSLHNFKTESGILIVGNESKGISDEIINLARHKISIPKKGKAESLNAAVATGIILSHLIR
jgi:RNA methyltransferase, TrmH family